MITESTPVRVQNLTNHTRIIGRFVLPPFNSPMNGWGELTWETAMSLRRTGNPDFYVPDLPPLSEDRKKKILDPLKAPSEQSEQSEQKPEKVEVKPIFKPDHKDEGIPPILILSTPPWGAASAGHTPIELCRAFAKMGHRVTYGHLPVSGISNAKLWEEYPPPKGVRTTASLHSHNFHAPTRSGVSEHGVLLMSKSVGLSGSGGVVIVTAPLPAFSMVAEMVKKQLGWKIIYHLVDPWGYFPEGIERPSWVVHDKGNYRLTFEEVNFLEGGADVVTATSSAMAEAVEKALGVQLPIIPNGYDPEYWPIGEVDPPDDLRIAEGKSNSYTIVFWGNMMGSWFDWSLILRTATELPNCEINLIGPVAKEGYPTYPDMPKELPKNVQLLGPKPITDLYKYGMNSDIGIIPFKPIDVSRFVDPIKTYEYIACGLTVLGMNVPEIGRLELPTVKNYRVVGSFINAIKRMGSRAKKLRSSDTMKRFSDEFAQKNSWEARARALLEAVGF